MQSFVPMVTTYIVRKKGKIVLLFQGFSVEAKTQGGSILCQKLLQGNLKLVTDEQGVCLTLYPNTHYYRINIGFII